MDDVVLNKAASIERCVIRVREEHAGDDRNVTEDQTRQDAIVLNIQRACEAAIDLAMHIVRREKLGIPQETREAFALLKNARIISDEMAERLMAMVGFRNVAVHEYQRLNVEVVLAIATKDLADVQAFARDMVRRFA